MKRLKKESFIALMFTLCIFISIVSLVPLHYLKDNNSNNEVGTYNYTYIDWEERYPFENLEEQTSKNVLEKISNKYISYVQIIENRISSMIKNNIIRKYPISEFYCKLQKTIGYKRFAGEDNSVLMLENDNYSYQSEKDNTINNEAIVENISEFQTWLNSQGIQYLYAMEPAKTSTVNDNIYDGYIDYRKYNMDTLTNLMEKSNISFMNLQEEAMKQGDLNALFYRTDHHWKPSTALWAARMLGEKLNNDYGYQIDVSKYDDDQFITEDLGNRFLGSQGKKVTLGVTEPDNFELTIPKYITNLHVTIENLGIDKTGTLEDTLIDKSMLREENYPYNYYSLNEYAAYGYGDQPLISIENKLANNNLKVLILKDSFVDSMGPYFSLGVHQLNLVDLRHFTGSIRTYIQELNPDIVITMRTNAEDNLDSNIKQHTNIMDYK